MAAEQGRWRCVRLEAEGASDARRRQSDGRGMEWAGRTTTAAKGEKPGIIECPRGTETENHCLHPPLFFSCLCRLWRNRFGPIQIPTIPQLKVTTLSGLAGALCCLTTICRTCSMFVKGKENGDGDDSVDD